MWVYLSACCNICIANHRRSFTQTQMFVDLKLNKTIYTYLSFHYWCESKCTHLAEDVCMCVFMHLCVPMCVLLSVTFRHSSGCKLQPQCPNSRMRTWMFVFFWGGRERLPLSRGGGKKEWREGAPPPPPTPMSAPAKWLLALVFIPATV